MTRERGRRHVALSEVNMYRRAAVLVLLLVSCGCAGVTVTPLDVDGAKKDGAASGLRYYLPRPYLLVVKLPAVAEQAPEARDPFPAGGAAGSPGAKKDTDEEG